VFHRTFLSENHANNQQLVQVREGLLAKTGQQGSMVLEPEQYRTSNRTNSTTFGIKEDGAWKFDMHRYKYLGHSENGFTFELLGTGEIVGNEFALNPV